MITSYTVLQHNKFKQIECPYQVSYLYLHFNNKVKSGLEKFSDHQVGVANRKIYIKNLPKNVTQEDFYYIFGKWFPDDEMMRRLGNVYRYQSYLLVVI